MAALQEQLQEIQRQRQELEEKNRQYEQFIERYGLRPEYSRYLEKEREKREFDLERDHLPNIQTRATHRATQETPKRQIHQKKVSR